MLRIVISRLISLCLLLGLALSSPATAAFDQESTAGSAVTQDPALATYRGGEIRASDTARQARFLRPDEAKFRQRMDLSDARNQADWIQRSVLRAIAVAEARERSFDQEPAVQEEARKAARDWLLQEWKERCFGLPLEVPSEEDLISEAEAGRRQVPPRIRVSHIFLRATEPAEVEDASRHLERLRTDLSSQELSGQKALLEAFQAKAREVSQSQTRFRGGTIGVLRPGWLPAAVEAQLQEVPEGALSPPIAWRGGVHLFLVEKKLPAELTPIGPKLKRLRAEADAKAREACRQQRLDSARERFEAIPTEPELLYRAALDPTPGPDGTTAARWITPEHRRHLEDLEADVYLSELFRRLKEAQLQQPSEANARARFEAQRERYRRRKQMEVQVLKTSIPEAADPQAFVLELEILARQLGRGKVSWDEIAEARPDAEIRHFPMTDILQLANLLGPRVFEQIQPLEPGQVGPLVQDEGRQVMVQVLALEAPRLRTFEEAHEGILKELAKEEDRRVTEEVLRELLAKYDFQLTEEGRRRTTGDMSSHEPGTPKAAPETAEPVP